MYGLEHPHDMKVIQNEKMYTNFIETDEILEIFGNHNDFK